MLVCISIYYTIFPWRDIKNVVSSLERAQKTPHRNCSIQEMLGEIINLIRALCRSIGDIWVAIPQRNAFYMYICLCCEHCLSPVIDAPIQMPIYLKGRILVNPLCVLSWVLSLPCQNFRGPNLVLIFCESSQLLRAQMEHRRAMPGCFTTVLKKTQLSFFIHS